MELNLDGQLVAQVALPSIGIAKMETTSIQPMMM